MKHVLSAQQFSKKELGVLFDKADHIRAASRLASKRKLLKRTHKGRIMATLFYEPSTRTRLSFESAAARLGMDVISTENAREYSSAIKGETIEDTTRTVASYADLIVMRHYETGAANKAAAVSQVPIINAGDGRGEHPTQALLDLYTILSEKHRLDNLTVVIGGDLAHGRTARSLAQLLAIYPNNQIRFVSTPKLRIGPDIKQYLTEKNTPFVEFIDMKKAFKDADVVYWTRLQKERLETPGIKSNFKITETSLDILPKQAIIMHPLPRVDEISAAVDKDPRAAYFRQVENGLYLRMALIDEVLNS